MVLCVRLCLSHSTASPPKTKVTRTWLKIRQKRWKLTPMRLHYQDLATATVVPALISRYSNANFTGRNRLKENICCELFTWLVVYGQKMHLRHLLTFCNFDELQLKIISWKSFPIKFEKYFPAIKKESRKLQFSFFCTLFANLCRKFAEKFRSIIFVIDLLWKAKQGFVASQRAPTLKP